LSVEVVGSQYLFLSMLVIVAMDAAMGMAIHRVDNQLAKIQERKNVLPVRDSVKCSEKSFNVREPVEEMLGCPIGKMMCFFFALLE
jgi:hypothetical protein